MANSASGPRPSVPTTAADAPQFVTRLLKSYDPKALEWAVADHRHAVVVAILTRGNAQAKDWLYAVMPREEVRELVRQYAGACCAEPARAQLREQLDLSIDDIPVRPYIGMGS